MFILAEHIPGKDNVAADSLSRGNLSLFHQQVPTAMPHPTPVPEELLQALIHQQPDWTSGSWRVLFNSILQKVQPHNIGWLCPASDQSYDKAVHLSVADIAVDDATSLSVLQVQIKESKTDPFRKVVCLFLGRTGSALCPVAAVVDYLCQRGVSPSPLFVFEDGLFLTHERFVDAVREALE